MLNGLGRIQPLELHKHFLRGSQVNRSTMRQEFERLHQAWPWSGLARFGPSTPKLVEPKLLHSVDPNTRARRPVDASSRSIRSAQESCQFGGPFGAPA
jgi:hypothetical protein